MQCRQCGTEIADKAIICYRCGAGTTDPVRRPVDLKGRPSGVSGLLPAIVLLLLAMVLFVEAPASGYPDALKIASGVVGVAGLALLAVRLVRRP